MEPTGTGRGTLLKVCLFATGCSGIVAEFTLCTLASYLLGNPTLQWTMVMSLMLFAMGLGSRWSRYFEVRLLDRFIWIEFGLSALCASCAAAAYFGTALLAATSTVIYGYAIAIGVLIGMEIPLVARMNEHYEALRTNIASVMEKDYFGALIGGLLFAFFALPTLGLTYTPIALGAVNFGVASVLLWRYRGLLARKRSALAAFWSLGAGIAILVVFMRPIVMFGEQSRYRDRVIYQDQTVYQRIVITRWKDHHWLYLDGSVQFSTYDEERYHEPLVHPAMGLAGSRREVLILGGGDGLAVREVLKYADVESVTLVDLDPRMVDLARSHPVLLAANQGALEDPRVAIVNRDAGRFLEDTDHRYDLIVVDLPDPKGPNLARLYSRAFYQACERHLSEDGVLVTQSTSPLHAPEAFLCIHRTMSAAGFAVVPFHTGIPTMGDWGWQLGKKARWTTQRQLRRQMEELDFEGAETRFLNPDAMRGMLHFWKGLFDRVDEIAVSTEVDPTVDRYYRRSDWGMD